MDADVNTIRETMKMAQKIIPLMTEGELLKINCLYLEVFERLKKEGRVREDE